MKKELKSKQKNALLIISSMLLLVIILGISYAYFMAQDQSAPQTITTANMGLVLDDGTDSEEAVIMASNISPIDMEDILTKAAKKQFTITNTGTEKMFVDISLENLTLPPDLERYDFMWSLYEVVDGTEKNISNGSFANVEDSVKVGQYQVFEAPVTNEGVTTQDSKTYNLYIWIEETYLNQNDMMNETFTATIVATGEVYWESPASDFTFDSSTGTITAYNGSGGSISIPAKIGDVAVTSIGEYAFDINQLTNVVIGNSVTKIGEVAFANNQLTNIVIPNSVTTIGSSAFTGNTNLTNVIVKGKSSLSDFNTSIGLTMGFPSSAQIIFEP